MATLSSERTAMKVLTLHQPWATALALGLKGPETRSWSTTYRGPLAIHAALQRPATGLYGDHRVEPWYDEVNHAEDCYCESDGVDVPCARRSKGRMVLTEEGRSEVVHALPLGMIVATCRLTDVVPMMTWSGTMNGPAVWAVHAPRTHFDEPMVLLRDAECAVGAERPPPGTPDAIDMTDQLPWGDYRPGRYAWILDDVEALPEPEPFVGGQGLTKMWTPT